MNLYSTIQNVCNLSIALSAVLAEAVGQLVDLDL